MNEYEMMCCFVFVNLTQIRVTQKEGASVEEWSPSAWPLDVSSGAFFGLMIDGEGSTHCGQVPGHVRKVAQKARKWLPPWFLLEFPPSVMDWDWGA